MAGGPMNAGCVGLVENQCCIVFFGEIGKLDQWRDVSIHAENAFGNDNPAMGRARSEEHTSELQSPDHLVCRLLLEKKKKNMNGQISTNVMRIQRAHAAAKSTRTQWVVSSSPHSSRAKAKMTMASWPDIEFDLRTHL